MKTLEATGLKPAFIDRHGPAYRSGDVDKLCIGAIEAGNFFERRVKKMTDDARNAIEKTEKVMAGFSDVLDRFLETEKRFAEQSKRASGSVRDAGEKLSQGLSKIEKVANFDRLQRYVELLERASVAMSALAELETSGKLEKIAAAIR